ncbi:MAG: UDP-N-acetylglucosamine--N-acetylmuramyl-(pentapeptide) pyrophosphoryl-undecaprenol N-acetylglucosamine transferase [Candidatus Omnitrophota bacterium]
MRVLLACDRSGGHIFPALTLGKCLSQPPAQAMHISFFVTSDSLKAYVVKEAFAVYGKSFRSRNIFLELPYRAVEALYLIARLRPQVVIGFGGRDSFFLILFGSLFLLNTVIYEPNVTFGKANRILSLFVRNIWRGFEEGGQKPKEKTIGIPLRSNIRKISRKEALCALGFDDIPVILCFGGSQGSSFLNSIFMRLVSDLHGSYQIIHLTGEREYFEISKMYNTIEQKALVRSFYYEMELLYSAASVVIARSGASTIAEICYYALPSVLIPHPAAGGHQRQNAEYLTRQGAAFVMMQHDFSFHIFRDTVKKLLFNGDLQREIAAKLRTVRLGVPFEEFCVHARGYVCGEYAGRS